MIYSRTMIKLNLHQVKAELSRYIEMVEAGEIVVVCKRNVPVAEIRPITQKERKEPELGWADDTLRVPDDFNQLTAEEVIQWEGDEKDPLRKYAPKK
jgi:antitoxin (DNA-binding transcriptional repressor) of toxin-antitoxin stability system